LCEQFIKYHKYEVTVKRNTVLCSDRDRVVADHSHLCGMRLYLQNDGLILEKVFLTQRPEWRNKSTWNCYCTSQALTECYDLLLHTE